jgi:hypothetical protein
MGPCCKELIAASLSADSENLLTVILLKEEISFPLQFEWSSSGMLISANREKPIAAKNHRTGF